MTDFSFAPASQIERIVFGAQRPGHHFEDVYDWIAFMKEQGMFLRLGWFVYVDSP